MDFAALPPEINSARMYAGPGSAPLLAAAAAWDQLADNLYSTAGSYQSVIENLTSAQWRGLASASMAAAAAPYLTWMTTTAGQAEQTATQARAAAAAYEAAFAMTVPPPVIAANRSLLMALIATNILGQNTPAIMATEAHYGEMWAQDAAAMYGYAANSAAASTLTPFTPPAHTTNPVGLAGQAAAVAHAAATSGATTAQTVMATGPQLMSAVPQALQGLASPLQSASSTSGLSSLSSLNSLNTMMSMTSSTGWISSALLSNANGLKSLFSPISTVGSTSTARAPAMAGGLGSGTGALGSGGFAGIGASGSSAASASLGRATSLGALSVPQTWAAATAPPISGAAALPGTSLGAAPEIGPSAPGGMLGGLPLAPMAGRGAAGTPSQIGFRPTVIPRPPAAG